MPRLDRSLITRVVMICQGTRMLRIAFARRSIICCVCWGIMYLSCLSVDVMFFVHVCTNRLRRHSIVALK